jgi:hypothetical protein
VAGLLRMASPSWRASFLFICLFEKRNNQWILRLECTIHYCWHTVRGSTTSLWCVESRAALTTSCKVIQNKHYWFFQTKKANQTKSRLTPWERMSTPTCRNSASAEFASGCEAALPNHQKVKKLSSTQVKPKKERRTLR